MQIPNRHFRVQTYHK